MNYMKYQLIFVSNIKNYRLSEINDVKTTTDDRYYSVVFLDGKIKQRYFKLVEKIASNFIDCEITILKFRTTFTKNNLFSQTD